MPAATARHGAGAHENLPNETRAHEIPSIFPLTKKRAIPGYPATTVQTPYGCVRIPLYDTVTDQDKKMLVSHRAQQV
jgi:hypothetical protein